MTLDTNSENTSNPEQKIALVKEELKVTKRVESERRHFSKEVVEEKVSIPVSLLQEDIEIKRVAVNREVTEVPQIRSEGDVTIVPIVREEIVIVKKKVLVEEIYIQKKSSSINSSVEDTIRKEIFKED